ncbi:AAA family ATPase, partial [Caldisalinibacter kiritimatiensis]|uniref:AAA family ATPase n=1 Tax=Caldisalinibacter kiritimatiensis TaxID=1304284 RepID=UPI000551E174
MKYIKKVVIENFQSHKFTEIELDKCLNVIVGPSDQGKSSIIRAIKWVLYNEPTGTFFMREGESKCCVSLYFSDNTGLKRIRTKSKNQYIYVDRNGKESVYEGFGKNVPIDIIESTNIRKLYLDSNKANTINIADQLEGPFLLSEKASIRANAIGRLVGVHIVDKAVSDTLKDIRGLNTQKKRVEDKLSELNKQLEKYKYLDELKYKIDKLDYILKIIKQKKEKKDKLKKLRNNY